MRATILTLLCAACAGPADYGEYLRESLAISCRASLRCDAEAFNSRHDSVEDCVQTILITSNFVGCTTYSPSLAEDCLDEQEQILASCDVDEHAAVAWPACDAFVAHCRG